MPESYGKRQRQTVKANKAAAREARRVARARRNADREAGLIEAGTPIEPSEPAALGIVPSERSGEPGAGVSESREPEASADA